MTHRLHIPTKDNRIIRYQCGLIAGQRVRLKKDLIVRHHDGTPTGQKHPAGEIWTVLSGITSDPVLWFRESGGERHTREDNAESVDEWFERIQPNSGKMTP